MSAATNTFKEKLDAEYSYPALYMFKFVVPAAKLEELKELFHMHDIALKKSSGGKYVGATVQMMVPSSDEIIQNYEAAAKIEGIIAL